ncbi:LysM peptidoglycan-binding domain-containing protein [Alicyclobacillus tolerans]|uniref:LysM peptidoglycan-binding domain-containing protein n=1 Tax=Alicyclobacillus tolerans TaxID=90970 RepID=UPI001F48D894|nr:LysM peptidoglycan-binding domain-containing protein [Alicyclobacillus tolerans]MCF8567231.1 LysM peptidoglycan-binding domain-containing protein [Alicyclobacillus tolerans]
MYIYTVVAGDELRTIAELFGTTTRELIRLNELESGDVLVQGLHLLVPGEPYLAVPYAVKTGDTYPAIALKNDLSLGDLEKWTGLRETKGDRLPVGRTVYVPKRIATKKTIETNGYLLPAGTNSDAELLRDIGGLTYLNVFAYNARADGTLYPVRDEYALRGAKSAGMTPMMTVTNFDGQNFNRELAHTLMSNSSLKSKLLENIINTLRKRGYRGVNMDFEHLRPEDRSLYNQLVREMASRIRPEGYFISAALVPKTSDNPTDDRTGAFDYQTLGRTVDFVLLMSYEWGWVGGPPLAGILQRAVKARSV